MHFALHIEITSDISMAAQKKDHAAFLWIFLKIKQQNTPKNLITTNDFP